MLSIGSTENDINFNGMVKQDRLTLSSYLIAAKGKYYQLYTGNAIES